MSVRMISIPLISGFSTWLVNSTCTAPSAAAVTFGNSFMVPVWSPTSATMSYDGSTVVPLIATLKTRWPAADVPVYRLAK